MKPLNVLSLFDGMSCGRVALERAGIPVANYFASEIDKYAIQIAMKNYPDTVQLGDVNGWMGWNLPKIDLLIGGSPCQGFSLAGKGLNFDDPRSKLFFVFVDILHAEVPTYFMLENVKMKREWRDTITYHLNVEPVLINSALVSAQNRKRFYWANWKVEQPEDRGILLRDIIEDGIVDRDKSYTIDANYHKGGNPKAYFEFGKRRVVFSHQSHRRAMVKVQGAAIRNQVTERGVEEQLNVRKDEKSNAVVPSYTGRLNGVYVDPSLYLDENEIEQMKIKKGAKTFASGKREGVIQFPFSLDRKSQCLLAGDIVGNARTTNVIDDGTGYRKLTPLECERLQTLPDGYTEGVSNTQRYKMLGNGWNVDTIAHIFSYIGE